MAPIGRTAEDRPKQNMDAWFPRILDRRILQPAGPDIVISAGGSRAPSAMKHFTQRYARCPERAFSELRRLVSPCPIARLDGAWLALVLVCDGMVRAELMCVKTPVLRAHHD